MCLRSLVEELANKGHAPLLCHVTFRRLQRRAASIACRRSRASQRPSDHDTNRLPKGSKIFERDALYQPALLSSVVRTSMT
jgi:hypothetical protein